MGDRHTGHDFVVVTGAGSGLGRAVAAQLAADGALVALLDRDLGSAEIAAAEIRAAGGSSEAVALDISDAAAVEAVIEALVDEHGAPSGLVNAAAIHERAHSHLLDPVAWDRIVSVNLSGTYYMCRAVLPHLMTRERAAIVNIASTAGLSGIPFPSQSRRSLHDGCHRRRRRRRDGVASGPEPLTLRYLRANAGFRPEMSVLPSSAES